MYLPNLIAKAKPCLGFLIGLFSLSMSVAHAQSTDTIDRIMKTHVVNIGVRDGAPPFSNKAPDGKFAGYSIDVCHKVVELMQKELKLPDLRAQDVEVSAANRFEKLKSGAIDMECTLSSNTKLRQNDFDFSYPVLFGALRFLTNPKAGLKSQGDLAGKTVAAIKGTSADKILLRLKSSDYPTLNIMYVPTSEAGLAAVESGRAQGFFQLDVLLEFLRATSKSPQNLELTTWPLTVEVVAFPMRKNDTKFVGMVNNSLKTLFLQSEFKNIYNKWFDGKVKFPMSGLMKENMQRPSTTPGFSLVMGVDL